jgi:hypothetical protein
VAEPDLWGDRARLGPRQLVFDVVLALVFTLVALAPAVAQHDARAPVQPL